MVIALFAPIVLGAALGLAIACLLGIWLPAGLEGSFLEPIAAELSRFAGLVLAVVLMGNWHSNDVDSLPIAQMGNRKRAMLLPMRRDGSEP